MGTMRGERGGASICQRVTAGRRARRQPELSVLGAEAAVAIVIGVTVASAASSAGTPPRPLGRRKGETG